MLEVDPTMMDNDEEIEEDAGHNHEGHVHDEHCGHLDHSAASNTEHKHDEHCEHHNESVSDHSHGHQHNGTPASESHDHKTHDDHDHNSDHDHKKPCTDDHSHKDHDAHSHKDHDDHGHGHAKEADHHEHGHHEAAHAPKVEAKPAKRVKKTHNLSLVSSVGFTIVGLLDVPLFNTFMGDLLAAKAADFYRTKGILAFSNQGDTKYVFQGVHEQINFGPAENPWKEDEVRISKMVFIGKNIDYEFLKTSLIACAEDPATVVVTMHKR